MTKAGLIRLALIAALLGMLEVMVRIGRIDPLTMQAPHKMVIDLYSMLASGKLNKAIAKTMGNAAIAFMIAVSMGVISGLLIHRLRRLRETLDPLFATYYAIPVFAFYPLLILLLGLGDAPQIFIGVMLGFVAVVVNTLNGLDRVPRVLLKTARVNGMNPFETALKITLPSAAPYILTGAKFAVAYSLIGVIGAEFIMSTGGMGYEISFAYNNFDNATMYPLIILILTASITINMLISRWEKSLLKRRGLQ
jgi:NitT/TauT family transport system permease protein